MEFSHSAGSGIFSFDRPGHGSRERCSTWVFGTPTPQQVEEKYNTMRPEDAYTKLEELILEEKYDLLLVAMEAVRHLEDNDVLIQAVVSISEAHNRIYALLRQAIHQEVTNFTAKALFLLSSTTLSSETDKLSISAFFREGSTATYLLSSWMFREGEPYLQRTLYPFVSNICKNEVCFEMDPHRETNPVKVEANLSRLLCTAKQVVDHICCSLNSIPNILRRIFCFLGSEIKQRFPEEVNMVLSGFFFLRFLCPALVTPNFYGICKEQPTPIASRSLILLSKLLQTVSTGAEFGMKEEYLSIPALNNFVAAYTPSLNRFFALLVEEDLLVPIAVPNTKALGSNGLTNGADSSWMYNSGNSTLNPRNHATDNNGLNGTTQQGSSSAPSLSPAAIFAGGSPRRSRALTQLSLYFDRSSPPAASSISPSAVTPSPLAQVVHSNSFSFSAVSADPPPLIHAQSQGHLSTPLPLSTHHHGLPSPAAVAITAAAVVQQSRQSSSPSSVKRSRVLNNFKVGSMRGSKTKKSAPMHSSSSPTIPEQDFNSTHTNVAAIRIIRELAGEVVDLRAQLSEAESQRRLLKLKNERMGERLRRLNPLWEDTETDTEHEERERVGQHTETETEEEMRDSGLGAKEASEKEVLDAIACGASPEDVLVVISSRANPMLLITEERNAQRSMKMHKRKPKRKEDKAANGSGAAKKCGTLKKKRKLGYQGDCSGADTPSGADSTTEDERGRDVGKEKDEREQREKDKDKERQQQLQEKKERDEREQREKQRGKKESDVREKRETDERERKQVVERRQGKKEAKQSKRIGTISSGSTISISSNNKSNGPTGSFISPLYGDAGLAAMMLTIEEEPIEERKQGTTTKKDGKDESSEEKTKKVKKAKKKEKKEKEKGEKGHRRKKSSEGESTTTNDESIRKKNKKKIKAAKKGSTVKKETESEEDHKEKRRSKKNKNKREGEAVPTESTTTTTTQTTDCAAAQALPAVKEKRKKVRKERREKRHSRHRRSAEYQRDQPHQDPNHRWHNGVSPFGATLDPAQARTALQMLRSQPVQPPPLRHQHTFLLSAQHRQEREVAEAAKNAALRSAPAVGGQPQPRQRLSYTQKQQQDGASRRQSSDPLAPQATNETGSGTATPTEKREESVNGSVKDEAKARGKADSQDIRKSPTEGTTNETAATSTTATTPTVPSTLKTLSAGGPPPLGGRRLSFGGTRSEVSKGKGPIVPSDENAALEEFKRKQKELAARRRRNSVLLNGPHAAVQWLQELYGEDNFADAERQSDEAGVSAPRYYTRSRAQTLDDIFAPFVTPTIVEEEEEEAQTSRTVSELKRKFNESGSTLLSDRRPSSPPISTRDAKLPHRSAGMTQSTGGLSIQSDKAVRKGLAPSVSVDSTPTASSLSPQHRNGHQMMKRSLSSERECLSAQLDPPRMPSWLNSSGTENFSTRRSQRCSLIFSTPPISPAPSAPSSPSLAALRPGPPPDNTATTANGVASRKTVVVTPPATPGSTQTTNELQHVFESIMIKRRGGSLRSTAGQVQKFIGVGSLRGGPTNTTTNE